MPYQQPPKKGLQESGAARPRYTNADRAQAKGPSGNPRGCWSGHGGLPAPCRFVDLGGLLSTTTLQGRQIQPHGAPALETPHLRLPNGSAYLCFWYPSQYSSWRRIGTMHARTTIEALIDALCWHGEGQTPYPLSASCQYITGWPVRQRLRPSACLELVVVEQGHFAARGTPADSPDPGRLPR